MKSHDWSDEELAMRRGWIKAAPALQAFDLLVSYGISSQNWHAGPGGHGRVKDFRFIAGGETPFAFITNREDLLFYLRSPGVQLLGVTRAGVLKSFNDVTEGSRGELKVRIRTEADAKLLISLILEKWITLNASSVPSRDLSALSRSGWSREEVEGTVADYFAMLMLELAGRPYNKAAHNRALHALLSNRSPAAVELKHQNISAILIELGCVYISGYKPRGNYQGLLREVVQDRIRTDSAFQAAASKAVERSASTGVVRIDDLRNILVDPPPLNRIRDAGIAPSYVRTAIQCDYLEREARNRALGLAGEEFIAEFEARRLHSAGYVSLANRVEHVSKSRGDGLGYDVYSFEPSGKERLIEVKTTSFGPLTPFYVSRNELSFSEEMEANFVLARVHEFRSAPRVFELRGSMKKSLLLEPVTYRALL